MLRFFVATHENLALRASRFRQWREKLRRRRSCEKPGERRWLIVRADRVIGPTAVFVYDLQTENARGFSAKTSA